MTKSNTFQPSCQNVRKESIHFYAQHSFVKCTLNWPWKNAVMEV